MAPRASAIKEQGFSKAVAVGIEAPQRGSTRSVIADNWVIQQLIQHNENLACLLDSLQRQA